MKSHFYAELAVERAIMQPGFRMVCVREVQKSLKESAKRLIEDKIETLGVGGSFRVLNDSIVTPGGGIVLFQGMQDHTAESIKSLEGFDVAWNEEGQTLSARSLEFLRPTIRKPGSELWFSWNPRNPTDPVDHFFRGGHPPPDAIVVRVSYRDNPWFPAELEQERLHDKKNNPERYAHIWEGEYEPAVVGAIWTRENIHEYRREEVPDLERIVVAVDPAVTTPEPGHQPNEHGVIVVGMGEDERGYVLDDLSCSGPPHKWASRAVAAFDKWEADKVVIEVNQGGDMVRHTLQSQRPDLPIEEVRATRGKHVRAEPISALYSLGRISHVGAYPELEDQMCKMTAAGYEGDGSPDRVDALVWGFSHLFPSMTTQKSTKRVFIEPLGSGGWMG